VFTALTQRQQFLAAQSLLSQSRAVAQLTGPAIAGVLVQAFSGPIALLLDSGSFLVSALSLRRSTPALLQHSHPPQPMRWQNGIHFVLHARPLLAALAATSTINFFYYMAQAVLMIFLTRTLRFPAGAVGLLTALGALGALAGASVAKQVTQRHGIRVSLLAGCVLYPTPLLLIPCAPASTRAVAYPMVAVALLGSGIGLMLLDIATSTLFNTEVPTHCLGSVTGVRRTINYGVRPIGAVLGGILGTLVDIRPSLAISLTGASAGWLWLLVVHHHDPKIDGNQRRH
jgi:Na+/melibiose symporter-like transporter